MWNKYFDTRKRIQIYLRPKSLNSTKTRPFIFITSEF